MYPSLSLTPAGGRTLSLGVGLALCVTLWFGLTALATPFDHDESQYIAGAYFSGRLTMFRDFLYLQPPLHGWAFAPLAWAFPWHMVVAMRIATAAVALCALTLMATTQRIAGISRDSAVVATLLIAATAAFQFTASVVRNDMLPTMLAAAGMAAALLALRQCRPVFWIASGVAFGLAISAKLSFAPLGIALGLFTLTAGGRRGMRPACLLALGGSAGLLPTLIALALAPQAFIYGVFSFAATGPFAWYAANGIGAELSMTEKLGDLLKYLATGPALIALLLLAANWWATRNNVRSPGRALAIWMVAGGLVGAAIPTPTHVQYLAPLLPPLALALGYFLDDARHWRFAMRETTLGLLALAAIPGLYESSRDLMAMARNGSPVFEATQNAHWAGEMVHDIKGGPVVTLSPHQIIDSGLALDPRLAAGPFVYRTGSFLTMAQARALNVLTPVTLGDLDRDPPAAILVGYEGGTRKMPLRPDDGLIAYARARGYRVVMMPDGVGRLYIKPARPITALTNAR
ncbi:glycosyltransferase family 39 protein [Sphingobium sp. AN558]|uniref:glycosyltransferase family 39 protein n=1 Tax=Sphingobium sp. AN558 TaxID=3133442 RepID=UPI0030BC6005